MLRETQFQQGRTSEQLKRKLRKHADMGPDDEHMNAVLVVRGLNSSSMALCLAWENRESLRNQRKI